jgi:protein-S-isoprenylcysteine O-methyltransferase Ste14
MPAETADKTAAERHGSGFRRIIKMNDVTYKYIIAASMIIWGLAEQYMKTLLRGKPEERLSDAGSGKLLNISTGFGCGLSSMAAFMNIGPINCCFPAPQLAGLAVTIMGLCVRIMAMVQLKQFFSTDFRIIKGHKIYRDGLYKFIRHPSYTGFLLILLGFGIGYSNWLSLILAFTPTAAVLLYRLKAEEKMMIGHFGNEYRDYMKVSKMLIPGVL